jgi:hypothetical protein
MGSHGGATADGQAQILRHLGVTEAAVPVPIRATMETLDLGPAENGARAHLDRIAAGADGIIVLGRTKTHPERAEGVASGLLKMVTVGLGKQAGAQEAHSHGLWESVEAVPKRTLAHAKVLFGVAVVENAYRRPVVIEVVPPTYEAFRDADERLLKVAQRHFARVPFDDLDVLVVDEMGKTISGTGMDLNVIGTWRASGATPSRQACALPRAFRHRMGEEGAILGAGPDRDGRARRGGGDADGLRPRGGRGERAVVEGGSGALLLGRRDRGGPRPAGDIGAHPAPSKARRSLKMAASVASLAGGFALRVVLLRAGHLTATDPAAARAASRATPPEPTTGAQTGP